MLVRQARSDMRLEVMPERQSLLATNADNCLLTGDDSSWKMSDWHWDSKAFTAKPVAHSEALPGSANYKKRKTGGLHELHGNPAACGGCRAKSTISLGLELKTESSDPVHLLPGSKAQQQHREVIGITDDAERSHECTCQADGCVSNLMHQSVWHQKSRICDKHMSGIFQKQGKAQQFCQQCGRSHNPDAFDKGRRSCRTQLAKHAARRRKSSAAGVKKDPTSNSSKGVVTAPNGLAAAAAAQATGCRAASTLASLAQQATSTDALLQSLCDNRSNSLALGSSQLLDAEHRHTSGASDQSLVSQPNFRQLLSSAVEPAIAIQQQQKPSQAYDAALDLTMPVVGEKPSLPCTTASQSPPAMTEELTDDPLQDILNWDLPEPTSISSNTSTFQQAMAFMHGPQTAEQTPFEQQTPLQNPHIRPSNSALLDFSSEAPGPGSFSSSYPVQASQLPVMAAPQQEEPQQSYASSFAAVRLSIKLFNSTPAQLPSNLRLQLTSWLNCVPAGTEGYIRPGCVHLTMAATVPSQASDAQPTPRHLSKLVDQLLQTPEQDVWHSTTMLVQLGSEAAVVHQGQILKAWSLAAAKGAAAATAAPISDPAAASAAAAFRAAAATATEASVHTSCCGSLAGLPSKLPELLCPQPACLVAGQQRLQNVRLAVQGWSQDCKVVCRAGGRHYEVQLRHVNATEPAESHPIEVLLPSQLPAGILFLEVQRGSFMGPELPLLIAPTPAVAEEALTLLQTTLPSDRQGLMVDLGFIFSSSKTCPAVTSVLLVRSASQILLRAVQHGAAKLTELLMSVLVKERLEVVGRIRGPSGMGLLHLAVRSGSCAVLQALLQPVNASIWQASWRGPGGLTPLHLVALLQDGQAMALQLGTTFGVAHWVTAAADDGLTPAQFAIRAGNHPLHQAMTSISMEHLTVGSDRSMQAPQVVQAPTSTTRLSSQKRTCPAEFVSVVPKKQKGGEGRTSSISSDSSGSSSSGEEDSCMSEPHVFSQLSELPRSATQDGLVGFVQSQTHRLAALCRANGWGQISAAGTRG